MVVLRESQSNSARNANQEATHSRSEQSGLESTRSPRSSKSRFPGADWPKTWKVGQEELEGRARDLVFFTQKEDPTMAYRGTDASWVRGDTHVSDGGFASPHRRLTPITHRPNPQISSGLHSHGWSHCAWLTPRMVQFPGAGQ